MDIWDYFIRKESEFDEMSVDGNGVKFYAEEGSNNRFGHMLGHVYLDDDVYLDVHERAEIVGRRAIHRTDYAYYLIIDGAEYWGYERDPTHNPAVHHHTYGHGTCVPSHAISFKGVCRLAWHEVSLRATTLWP